MNSSARPRVSVIIPVYNGSAYLDEAIESVLAQSYNDFEIVVVDDGSTDTSPALIGGFGTSVRALRQENRGTGAARNRGVEAARGSLLAFLDQDDVWDKAKLERQVAALDADPSLQAVFTMVRQFHSPELGDAFKSRVLCSEEPLPGYLPSAMLLRASAYEKVGRFAENWQLVEWTEWFVRATEAGLVFTVLPQILVRRRLHESNKGMALRASQGEYPKILKALLDCRRASARDDHELPK